MEKIKVASVQMEIIQGDKNANLQKALEFIKKASSEKTNLICFSEYFSTGFDPKHANELAEPIPGRTTEILGENAKKFNISIAAPILEVENKNFYSTLVLVGSDGKIHGKHRKVHPWMVEPREEEIKLLTPGENFDIMGINGTSIGCLIDADMDFPEPARILALKGAEIILIPFNAESLYKDLIRTVPMVRAIDNVTYVVTANRIGTWRNYKYAGGSIIISPTGDVLASIDDKEGMITATLDIMALRKMREDVSCPFKRFNIKAYADLKHLFFHK
jgi:predicted amidohydrolase